MDIVIEITATILTIVRVMLSSIPKRISLWILGIGQVLWIFFAISKEQNFFLIQCIILLIFDIYGLYSWKKKGIK